MLRCLSCFCPCLCRGCLRHVPYMRNVDAHIFRFWNACIDPWWTHRRCDTTLVSDVRVPYTICGHCGREDRYMIARGCVAFQQVCYVLITSIESCFINVRCSRTAIHHSGTALRAFMHILMHDEIQHAHFVAGLHIKTSAPTCKAMWLAEWPRYGSDTEGEGLRHTNRIVFHACGCVYFSH